ncbi:hypothetical protein [Nocardioides limicola]|uniref:hypothetical protein n=1 Tax=Nocardioides limicola TaxID=2803368 RepID=UPI00193B16C9|nr:hypothetical protein [Nocardioides sp. DJM-14]
MDDEDRIPQSPEEFMAAVRGTQYEEFFRDEGELDRLFVRLLSSADDEMAKEVSHGLRDGSLTPRAIASGSAYQEFLASSVTKLGDTDFKAVFRELAAQQRVHDQHKSSDDREE